MQTRTSHGFLPVSNVRMKYVDYTALVSGLTFGGNKVHNLRLLLHECSGKVRGVYGYLSYARSSTFLECVDFKRLGGRKRAGM